jgi:hypothetical protein
MELPIRQDLEKLCHHSQIYFAIFCAEQVFHIIKQEHQPVCRQAIDIAKLFLEGKATKEECRVAADAAAAAYATYTAATANYAAYAAYAAANAADAATYVNYAAYAAYAAAYAAKDKQVIIEAQWVYYKELLAFETIIEDILLA